MTFNITKLDKVILLQALYIHADPKGHGILQYNQKDAIGKNVIGLSDEECKNILSKAKSDFSGYLVDYHNGKPIKLDFDVQENGDIWVSSNAYDISHGRFRFLEALLSVFDLEEIIITDKDYPHGLDELLDTNTKREDCETQVLKNIIEQTIEHFGNITYWTLDCDNIFYAPPFMRGI